MGGGEQVPIPKRVQTAFSSGVAELQYHDMEDTLNRIAQAERSPVSGRSAAKKFSLDMFELGEELPPEGTENDDEDTWRYEHTFFARERSSGTAYALRIIDKNKIRGRHGSIFRKEVQRQIDIPANLQHPNILRLYGTFEDDHNTNMVIELPEKEDLYKRLKAETRFPEEKAARYIVQVAAGLHFLHSRHIMHRDLKPEHLRLGMDGQVKISGFKWAVWAPPPNDKRNKTCGTLDYLSPEMLKPSEKSGSYSVSPGLQSPEDNYYTNKIDVWSLGILTYEFVAGVTPWGDVGPIEIQKKISKGEMTVPDFVSVEAKDLILKLLVLDPDERLSLEEVRKHPWIIKHHTKDEVQGESHLVEV